jgi:hypothetical protein
MPLSPSGPIKMSQIKTELGSSSNSLRAYSAAAGKSAPDVMSEFFGYSASPAPAVTPAPAAPSPAVTPAPAAPSPAVTPAPAAPSPAVTPSPAAPSPAVTPSPTYYSFNLGYDSGDAASACNASRVDYYSLCTNLGSGDCTLFTSAGSGYAPNGYYSNGINVYYVEGNGYINTISLCPAPAPAITPSPTPSGYTEYYNCPDGGMWYIQGENLPAKINRAGSSDCMTKVQEHATPPGGNEFFSYTSVNCDCE